MSKDKNPDMEIAISERAREYRVRQYNERIVRAKSHRVILNRIKRGKFCCPVCGDYRMNIYDHQVGYPEIWVDWNCKNCGQWVGGADNSLPAHITESMRDVRSMKDIRRMLDILV